MNTIGVLLLAAAAAGDGFGYDKPNVGGKKLWRHGVVSHGAPPPGGMLPPGAGGMGADGAMGGRRFPNVRSQIFFLDPDGMQIGWQTGASNGERVLSARATDRAGAYNFMQGYIYRLKIAHISRPSRGGLYPTIEVAPSTPATDAYLTHNPIPVQFTPEDFDQVVDGGNFVTKVIYLPDPKYQELAVAGVETLVSTRLEPGVDPILEADKRGTILLIVRLGAIDLEGNSGAVATPAPPTTPAAPAPGTAPVVTPVPASPAGTILVPPAAMPPGAVPAAPPATESVPVDNAPVTAAPPGTPAPAPAPAPAATTPPPPPAAPAAPAPAPPPPAVPPARWKRLPLPRLTPRCPRRRPPKRRLRSPTRRSDIRAQAGVSG